MNEGKCGAHHYQNIDKAKIDIILKALKESGAGVTGNNPWNFDTRKHNVKLQGTWDQDKSLLTVIVTDKNIYVSCPKIWDEIDPLVNRIQKLSTTEIEKLT
jgi:hypothetical protein